MQRLVVSCAVRPIYGSLGAKGFDDQPVNSLSLVDSSLHFVNILLWIQLLVLSLFCYMYCNNNFIAVNVVSSKNVFRILVPVFYNFINKMKDFSLLSKIWLYSSWLLTFIFCGIYCLKYTFLNRVNTSFSIFFFFPISTRYATKPGWQALLSFITYF
jgi:hypothetical protein